MEFRCICQNCGNRFFDSELTDKEFEELICPYCGGKLDCVPEMEPEPEDMDDFEDFEGG